MTVSFHKFGEFFPGTGDIRDVGHGRGKYYSVNVPLRDGIDDESYHSVFEPVIEHVMQFYRPGAIVLQCGADSLAGDRLGCFNLSHRGHARCVEFVKKFNVPLMILGGGGYTIRNVARAWAYETAICLDRQIADEIPFNDYFEYYGPDYSINVPSNNMVNLNTPEYLDKCKQKIMENLRHCEFAPSVQIQDVPRDMFSSSDSGASDSEDDSDDQDNFRGYTRDKISILGTTDTFRTGFDLYRESIRAKERDRPFGDDFTFGTPPEIERESNKN